MKHIEEIASAILIIFVVIIAGFIIKSNTTKKEETPEPIYINVEDLGIRPHHVEPYESHPIDEEDEPEEKVEEIDSEIPLLRTDAYVKLTDEECDLLEAVAMAEAEGEDARGKALVMRVVLNRSLKYNMSIKEVIYSPKQFCIDRMDIEPSEDCHEALSMIIDGLDESQGALYFSPHAYSKYGEPLFQHGNHFFSR